MLASTYAHASEFLNRAQDYLERHEVINGLMLGIAFSLRQSTPETAPYLAIVEDGGDLALAAVMTPPNKLVLYSHLPEPDDAIRTLNQQLRDSDWTIPGVLGPANAADAFARLWDQPARPGMFQRVYELREVKHPIYPPGSFRTATTADLDVIARWIQNFYNDIGTTATSDEARKAAEARITKGTIVIWENEAPVSMAAQSRPTQHGIAVNFVYTPPAERRKGYATACVARLSQHLLEAGYAFCTLFTDLANPTSNNIYQQIGYVPVCDFNEYHFVRGNGPA